MNARLFSNSQIVFLLPTLPVHHRPASSDSQSMPKPSVPDLWLLGESPLQPRFPASWSSARPRPSHPASSPSPRDCNPPDYPGPRPSVPVLLAGAIKGWSPACHQVKAGCRSKELSITLRSPPEYLDYQEVFSKAGATSLPPHRAYNCAIDLQHVPTEGTSLLPVRP